MTATAQTTPSRGRRRLAVASAVATSVVVALAAYLSWPSGPSVFGGYGNLFGTTVATGETRMVNLFVAPPDEPVELRTIRAVVTTNTSGSTIDYLVCTDDLSGSSDDLCTSTRPLADADLNDIDWDRESLVARISPRRAGVVRIEGVDVTYARGWQHLWRPRTERAGIEVVVRTR